MAVLRNSALAFFSADPSEHPIATRETRDLPGPEVRMLGDVIFIVEVIMGVLDWLLIALIGLFALGAIGCLMALPSVVFQFVGVLFEKDLPAEERERQQQEQAAD